MRQWPEPKTHRDKVLRNQIEYGNQMMRDAIILAMYLKGMDRPTFMDKDILHTQRTFGVELWDDKSRAI